MDCPACSGPVTLEVGPDQPLSASLTDVLLAADENECIDVSRNCWNCGWQEVRQIRVESIDITDGDEIAVKRASLIEEITDELAAVERLATLEDTLAEVRRQQRMEPSTDSTEDGTTE